MTVIDLFSKRQKRNRGEVPDIYSYDSLPSTLRVQIVHIIRDAIGKNVEIYEFIYDTLCREYGLFELSQNDHLKTPDTAIYDYFLSTDDLERASDVVELSFRAVDKGIRDHYSYERNANITPDDALAELNFRCKEHGVGFLYESGHIIRVDEQLLHAEVVKPALQILGSEELYSGANEEFLKAHEHYRKRNSEECLNECLKAFESTMKAICSKRNWPYNQDDTAKQLIAICFSKGLIPKFLQSEFSSFRSVLESGIPTARNKLSGHGKGVMPRQIPEYFVSYVLHLTATNILLLAQAERKLG